MKRQKTTKKTKLSLEDEYSQFHLPFNTSSPKIPDFDETFSKIDRTISSPKKTQSESKEPGFIREQQEFDILEMYDKNPHETVQFLKNSQNVCFDNKNVRNVPYFLKLTSFPGLRHLNNIIMISGTIIKVNPTFLTDIICYLKCISCDFKIKNTKKLKKTELFCVNCKKSDFIEQQDHKNVKSLQSIRIQNINDPRTVTDTILIEIKSSSISYMPGEHITVTGRVFIKYPSKFNFSPELFIDALKMSHDNVEPAQLTYNVQLENLSPFERQKFLIRNFCPEIIGYDHVKLGLLLSSIPHHLLQSTQSQPKNSIDGNHSSESLHFSGRKSSANCSSSTNKNAQKKRTTSHVLISGPPGTAKTRLLRFTSKIRKSIFINAVNTSEAGLTTSAIRTSNSDSGWELQAGALVLSDNGLCLIDSFSDLNDNDKLTLLEVMELQTLTTTKACILSTHNARCTIIAAQACSFYDFEKTVEQNLNISTPLVSRFDLIFFQQLSSRFNKMIVNHVLNHKKIKPVWNDQHFSAYLQFVTERRNFKGTFGNEKQSENRNLSRDLNKNTENSTRENDQQHFSTQIDKISPKYLIKLYFNYKKKTTPSFTLRNLQSIFRLSNSLTILLQKIELDTETLFTVFFLLESTVMKTENFEFSFDEKVFTDQKYFYEKIDEMTKMLMNY